MLQRKQDFIYNRLNSIGCRMKLFRKKKKIAEKLNNMGDLFGQLNGENLHLGYTVHTLNESTLLVGKPIT